MIHTIKNQNVFIIATNGRNIFHEVQNTESTTTSTGQPMVYIAPTEEIARETFWDTYEEIEETPLEFVKVHHPFKWSVGYTLEEATTIRDFVNDNFGNITLINYLKHPERDEYAIPVQEKIFASYPDSAEKAYLLNAHQQIISKGRSKMEQEMIDLGWF